MYMYLHIHVYTYTVHVHTYMYICTKQKHIYYILHVHTHVHVHKLNVYTGHSSHAIKVITKAVFIARRRQQQLLVWIYTWNHFVSTNESCTASPSPSSLGSPQEKLTMQGRNINPTHACIHTSLLTHK